MEILTDYFAEGYEILYNFKGPEIKDGQQITRFTEKRLGRGDKILVVVDDVHSERRSAIFCAMDIISSHKDIQNIRFLLAARTPDYDWFVGSDRLNQVQEGKESIERFSNEPEFRFNRKDTKPYDPLFFTKDEIN